MKTFKLGTIQAAFNWEANATIRDEAIATAVTGADATSPTWSTSAYKMLQKFIGTVPDFITEDFREYCEANNLPSPPEARAYGGIMQKASRDKIIVPTGEWRPMKAKNCHLNPKRVWRKN